MAAASDLKGEDNKVIAVILDKGLYKERFREFRQKVESKADLFHAVEGSKTITVVVEKKPSWFNLYTIIIIVAVAAGIGIFAFLYLRQREMREREKAEEERRKMQQKKRRPAVPMGARPKAP